MRLTVVRRDQVDHRRLEALEQLMKIAIVHEWLESYAGSERVLEQMIHCYPTADVFAVVDFVPPQERGFLQGRPVKTSFIQGLPFAKKKFRAYLPLMPAAVEQFDLAEYDLILSSSHAVAKGVLTGPNQVHVSYVHSPMRYAWDQQAQYLRQAGLDRGLKAIYAKSVLHHLRIWDVRTAHGVDQFVANSSFIAARIYKVYRRRAIVLHPPVDIEAFQPGKDRSDVYVIASRLVPYKRVDLVVEAFRQMPTRRLLVIGTGSELPRVRELARSAPNIEIVDPLSRDDLIHSLRTAGAFVFAGEEDFGITLVEAQACGTPVIAFGRGGAVDIVRDGVTGILFNEQTPSSIINAVQRFEAMRSEITVEACRSNAERFSIRRFRTGILSAVETAMKPKDLHEIPEMELTYA
jgi:glycosyltransferase involved in cell wall biosynthesis